ncbi:MAG: adenylyl-sulfate kinase, partial [Gemmatimonadaceae bacterium]
PKGLYAKARTGAIPDFTGISSPYEEPERPELTADTEQLSAEAIVAMLERLLEESAVIESRSEHRR